MDPFNIIYYSGESFSMFLMPTLFSFFPFPLFLLRFPTQFLTVFNTVLNIPCLATTALQGPAVQIGTLSGGTSCK